MPYHVIWQPTFRYEWGVGDDECVPVRDRKTGKQLWFDKVEQAQRKAEELNSRAVRGLPV